MVVTRGTDTPTDFAILRQRMVEQQIAARDVRDESVLAAMRTVPRHLFVPEQHRALSYDDCPIMIGSGQTISQPYIVASMTEHLEVDHGSRVLEIGTGSGYQAAVLAEIVQHVYTIEILPELFDRARHLFEQLHYRNIHCRLSDGSRGWNDEAPFDAIIVTAAAPKVPTRLVRQLREGGVLVVPLEGQFADSQRLVKLRKQGDRAVQQTLYQVRFVPMTGSIS